MADEPEIVQWLKMTTPIVLTVISPSRSSISTGTSASVGEDGMTCGRCQHWHESAYGECLIDPARRSKGYGDTCEKWLLACELKTGPQ